MNKLIFTWALLASFFATAQVELKRDSSLFYTTVSNGLGVEVPLKFSIAAGTLDSVLASASYQRTQADTTFLREAAKRYHTTDTLALHLMSKVNSANYSVRSSLKNQASLQIPAQQVGLIFWAQPLLRSKGGFRISYTIQAQNGYGNMIFMEASYDGTNAVLY